MATRSGSKIIVAALDFGTTYSGYAYSFTHEYQKDPLKIQANHWIGGDHISLKAPTTVLFNPQKVFHSFGYEAEDKYGDLAEEDDHKNWYYFRRFKMLLYENKVLSRKTLVLDEHNKPFPASHVFASAIKYLRDHLMEAIRKRVPEVNESDVKWILTVPAIWNDSAKQFMREAAIEAGLPSDELLLALEPEAASILCKQLPIDRFSCSKESDFRAFETGTTYMVLDLGGGTIDVTVHSVQDDGSLSEVAKASGGAWGGTQVDDSFVKFIQDVTGEDVFAEFRDKNTGDYLDMMREFEAKKRSISTTTSGMVNLRIPASLTETFKRKKKRSISDYIATTQFEKSVIFRRDKMQIDADIVKTFFSTSITNTIEHIRVIFAENEFQDIDVVLMVGGFAESDIVRESVKEAFRDRKIVTPSESGLVVLKGAVLFGHNPAIVSSRVSKYTYGTEVHDIFKEDLHPEEYKYFHDGNDSYWCRNIFDPFVLAGEVVPVDKIISKEYTTTILDVTEGVGIYASSSRNPRYVVDADCFRLGKIYLDEPNHTILVEMHFGNTEFSVQITDLDTGNKRINCFDFLCD